MGRPTKIEGNPDHPASLGATDLFSQASILSLYDPDRSQVILKNAQIATWDAFLTEIRRELSQQRAKEGAGLRLLTQSVISPTLAAQIETLLEQYPQARWHQYEPINRDNALDGARLAFGRDVNAVYHFDQAQVVLSLESDFLDCTPQTLRYMHDFMALRRVRAADPTMNRLYVAECMPSKTGAAADHRLRLRSGEIMELTRELARRLQVGPPVERDSSRFDERNEFRSTWLDALVDDLSNHRGASVVLAGENQPPAMHALVHAINAALDNVGKTVVYTEPLLARPENQTQSLAELAGALRGGEVDLLLILDGNPVFDAPADLGFAERIAQARCRMHLSYYADETSALCQWHIPLTHYLESWGDTRAFDGTVTIQQPLIDPLFQGKSAYEFLSALIDESPRPGLEIVREHWRRQHSVDDFDTFWQTSLHNGVVADTALQPIAVEGRLDSEEFQDAVWGAPAINADSQPDTLELNFRPDPSIWDGRFANNGWLQELPKPLTKITWDNVAHVSPATAAQLEIANHDQVELRFKDRTVLAPVWIMPGHADGAVTVHLGFGRTAAGNVGNGVGFNAYRLRTSDALGFGGGLTLRKTGARHIVATTQTHWNMEGRHLVRSGTLDQYKQDPHALLQTGHDQHVTLYPAYEYKENAWGMAIDLTACTGCNACVVACQAENNTPIVGKSQVLMNREMHWLRIDTYYSGEPDDPEYLQQPMLCMHCENAPCEVVCPVAATVHSSEGLNVMVYNRCVGTRYCSNNCPYKVRRFNFLQYSVEDEPLTAMLHNPDVTVRSRGVMEKCSYCVQRISAARINAKTIEAQTGQPRPIQDGEVVTACQAACPARAIVFGNINDRQSQVAQWKAEPTNYGVLTELNTQPRTTYLARVRNPHPLLAEKSEI
jgi:molybdopterin-containing oxidoreductase family iron-sulfur binding subunit